MDSGAVRVCAAPRYAANTHSTCLIVRRDPRRSLAEFVDALPDEYLAELQVKYKRALLDRALYGPDVVELKPLY